MSKIVTLEAEGNVYTVEFRYQRQAPDAARARAVKALRKTIYSLEARIGEPHLGFTAMARQSRRPPELLDDSPVGALSVCVIRGGPLSASAIGTAICLRRWQWSRRAGREASFGDAVRSNPALVGDVGAALLAAFHARFPAPKRSASKKLTQQEKDRKHAEGEAKRMERWRARGGTAGKAGA